MIISKEAVNLISLIIGIVLIIIGLSVTVILIPDPSSFIIVSIIILIIGAFLSIMGGLRKWKAVRI